ncbi:MAG TPA: hypothetical protein VK728_16975 [Candidatus Sulfotelmatobacter sp.]|jgi:hypothetical protein|nr:hypothetical protein [Candidatus Sulfotelmatobacter sp.]
MVCDVCGQDFLVRHSCPGPIPTGDTLAPPEGVALLYYLGEAWRIVRWNESAIRRVKDDPRSVRYGMLFWTIGITIPSAFLDFFGPVKDHAPFGSNYLFRLAAATPFGIGLCLFQLSIIHLIAKYFCGGDGKFIQVVRPLSLASLIFLLQALPAVIGVLFGGISWATLGIAGYLLGNIAWVASMVMVFDVVDGMDQLTSFITSIASVFGLSLLFEFILKQRF